MRTTEKSKIGILSMFYNSTNYGGILQAYALIRYLKINGYRAEQICYNLYSAYSLNKRIKIIIKKYLQIISNPRNIKLYRKIEKRNKIVVRAANRLVPHSEKVYKEKNIGCCINQYSMFITGSDQVWHGEWPAYFLAFVPKTFKKIAYAVSTGKSTFTMSELEKIRNYSRDFTAISVREADTLSIFRESLNKKQIELVLDPTLLLSVEEWNDIVAPRKLSDRYLFCYFLGSDIKLRNLAIEYAKTKNIKIVTIPHMQQRIEPHDIDFGDIQEYGARPQDFLSYIRYAEAVFTDSFHASIFSNIFHVQYYVFGRAEQREMGNRIETLTNMFHSESHFINKEEDFTLEFIQSLCDIDYTKEMKDFTEMQERSRSFIIHAIS